MRCFAGSQSVGDAVLWHYMFSQLGIQLWPVHSVSPATFGDYHWTCLAVEERIAIVKARVNNAERNYLCRFHALATDKYVVKHECRSYSFAPTRLRDDSY